MGGWVRLSDVHPTDESVSVMCIPLKESDSVMCIPPMSQSPWCASHWGVRLSDVHPTDESVSVMCIPLRSQTQWCASHRGVSLRDVHPPAEPHSSVCIIPRSQTQGVHHIVESNCTSRSENRKLYWSLVAFKGTIRWNPLSYQERKDLKFKK